MEDLEAASQADETRFLRGWIHPLRDYERNLQSTAHARYEELGGLGLEGVQRILSNGFVSIRGYNNQKEFTSRKCCSTVNGPRQQ